MCCSFARGLESPIPGCLADDIDGYGGLQNTHHSILFSRVWERCGSDSAPLQPTYAQKCGTLTAGCVDNLCLELCRYATRDVKVYGFEKNHQRQESRTTRRIVPIQHRNQQEVQSKQQSITAILYPKDSTPLWRFYISIVIVIIEKDPNQSTSTPSTMFSTARWAAGS